MSSTSIWDPLESNIADQEILSSAKKREIKNILKSYVGTYDPMSELIQNAMDAIERRIENEKSSKFEPKVTIKINLNENSFEVTDNGCGFEVDEFKSFLAPNISFKDTDRTRGNKGVGATYIAYGFNDLYMKTGNNSFRFEGVFKNGRNWVDDTAGRVPRPKISQIKNEDNKEEFQGTTFKISFGGKGTRPKDLGWYQANSANQWLYILLTKTPLGHISLPGLEPSDIKFDIEVTDKENNTTHLKNQSARYMWPHNQINASIDLNKIRKLQTEAIHKGKDPTRIIEKYSNSNGVYDIFSKEHILSLTNIRPDDKLLIERYNISSYGYFVYSTSVWDIINDSKAELRKGYRVLKGGLQLSNNGMVQGDMITIPLTKSIGHQNQAHIVIHFEGADPDLGRKGFQPELRDLAERIAVVMVSRLAEGRKLLKNDSGAKPEIEKQKAIHEWVRDQEKHEEDFPLVLKNQNFFLPTKKISIQSVPVSEQDVIVLFNQLIAGGVIRGIRLLATSQTAQYDGIFRFVSEEPLSNIIFDKNNNPLGVDQEQCSKTYLGPPQILEYKFSLDGLIHEFESEIKDEKDVNLAIFWSMGSEYKRNYNILSLLDLDNTHQRHHHGITHIIKSSTSRFYAICLEELINFLNDIDGCQDFQKNQYGIDI